MTNAIQEKTALCSTVAQAEREIEKLINKLASYYSKKENKDLHYIKRNVEVIRNRVLATDSIRMSVLMFPDFLKSMQNAAWDEGELYYDEISYRGILKFEAY